MVTQTQHHKPQRTTSVLSQGHACHTASVLHIQCHTFSYTTWYHTGSVTGLNNVTGLYRQCHRTPQTVGLLTSHNPWLHKVSHQSTTHCHRPIFKMSQSVSHIATLLHKASRGCQGLEASLSLSLSLTHTHTHTHTHTQRHTKLHGRWVCLQLHSPRCTHSQPLQPPTATQAGVWGA